MGPSNAFQLKKNPFKKKEIKKGEKGKARVSSNQQKLGLDMGQLLSRRN